ncbi:hypothetical protein FOMPIDRAFT_131142 [Fomitopsis schrenkii]|uniref:Uncharacterized protein n=1 Tax=Fomitopsis schrenkii TaxID=2126942 RepID=S8EA18_FOMSC|nr:hypothetical protein FOMPIDRAFT_131142 [Fomitopsis schrenkii]
MTVLELAVEETICSTRGLICYIWLRSIPGTFVNNQSGVTPAASYLTLAQQRITQAPLVRGHLSPSPQCFRTGYHEIRLPPPRFPLLPSGN